MHKVSGCAAGASVAIIVSECLKCNRIILAAQGAERQQPPAAQRAAPVDARAHRRRTRAQLKSARDEPLPAAGTPGAAGPRRSRPHRRVSKTQSLFF